MKIFRKSLMQVILMSSLLVQISCDMEENTSSPDLAVGLSVSSNEIDLDSNCQYRHFVYARAWYQLNYSKSPDQPILSLSSDNENCKPLQPIKEERSLISCSKVTFNPYTYLLHEASNIDKFLLDLSVSRGNPNDNSNQATKNEATKKVVSGYLRQEALEIHDIIEAAAHPGTAQVRSGNYLAMEINCLTRSDRPESFNSLIEGVQNVSSSGLEKEKQAYTEALIKAYASTPDRIILFSKQVLKIRHEIQEQIDEIRSGQASGLRLLEGNGVTIRKITKWKKGDTIRPILRNKFKEQYYDYNDPDWSPERKATQREYAYQERIRSRVIDPKAKAVLRKHYDDQIADAYAGQLEVKHGYKGSPYEIRSTPRKPLSARRESRLEKIRSHLRTGSHGSDSGNSKANEDTALEIRDPVVEITEQPMTAEIQSRVESSYPIATPDSLKVASAETENNWFWESWISGENDESSDSATVEAPEATVGGENTNWWNWLSRFNLL